MKSIVLVLLSFFSASVFAGAMGMVDPLDVVGDRCAPGDIVFYGQTEKGHKEVLVCRWDNDVFYSYGKIGQKPELYLKVNVRDVRAQVEDTDSTSGEQVIIKNGNTLYYVGAKSYFNEAKDVGWVNVTDTNGKKIVDIPLVGSGTISDIRNQF